MILSPVKAEPDGKSFIEVLLKSSWHRHLKHSKPYTFIKKRLKKPPNGLCNLLLFASAKILIFGGLFIHRISRILKFKLNWLRVPTTDFARQKLTTMMENPCSSNVIWKARKNPSKGHPKNRPLFPA